MRRVAYGRLGLKPRDLEEISPGDLREMVDAEAEQTSIDREVWANLVALVVNTCARGKLKKELKGTDLLGHSDKQRALRRELEWVQWQREQAAAAGAAGKSTVIKSDDWGEL